MPSAKCVIFIPLQQVKHKQKKKEKGDDALLHCEVSDSSHHNENENIIGSHLISSNVTSLSLLYSNIQANKLACVLAIYSIGITKLKLF